MSDRRRLRLTLGLLVAIVLALAVAQRQPDLWPFVTWPVYADVRPDVPGPTTSLLEVRTTTGDGRTEVTRAEDLVERSRHRIADEALDRSVDVPEDRAYLARLVGLALDRDVQVLELWKVTWPVDPDASTPIRRDRPAGERLLVRFGPDGAEVTP